MAGTTRLKIYNGSLELLGSRELASLSEERKPRRLLDRVWNSSGVRYCLEQGEWQFAMRAQELDNDPAVETDFGFAYAFNKPTDWVATHAVCSDPYYNQPLTRYNDETEFLYADITPIYWKYVSDDASFGGDLTKWPQSFCNYVDAYFASKICISLTKNKDILSFLIGQPGKTDGGELGKRLKIAKSRAGMTQPTRFPAQGGWTRSRQGRSGGRGPMGDGGLPGSLIG